MARGLGPHELRELYERYAPMIHRRALALLGRDADAWDVVQEVFERLLKSGSQFRHEARPTTYVYRVTTNVALNALRARSVREPGRDPESAPDATADHAATEAADLLRVLSRSVPDRQMEVAVLHYLDGMTQEEIAEVLGLSRKTIGRDLEQLRARAAELAAAPGGKANG